MNAFSAIFLAIAAILLLLLPRRWAALPLLSGACYMTLGQGVEVGPFTFTVIRILLLFGFLRVALRGESIKGGLNTLDWLFVAWGICAWFSSVGHKEGALVYRLGWTFDYLGVYFLTRSFCRSFEEVVTVIKLMVILLIPVALEMLQEKMTARNLFAVLGGVPETCYIREGKVRAQGPFLHAILAGTVGAACFPLAVGFWSRDRRFAILAIAITVFITFASGSSGPLMSAMASGFALFVWRYRHRIRTFQWMAVLTYFILELVMKDPAYFIMEKIDLTGGSTGWHRAALIQAAFQHLNEWWLVGTDYTRHWLPTGVSWSPDHTDITNHYIKMGIEGGLALMFLFIAILAKAFCYVGELIRRADLPRNTTFMVWAMGSSLFAHAASCISVSYFDQSYMFLCLNLGIISSTYAGLTAEAASSNEASNPLEDTPPSGDLYPVAATVA